MSAQQSSQPAQGTQAAAFEMLMNAIGSLLSPVVQQLLNSDPSLVHFKGWNGMTPLHRACLIGDYNIILMLIQANSDVNAETDFLETPLHYASKRGIPSVVHLLIQCGAKLDARDKKGRSAVHHAAENGAVQVIKYYEEAFGVDLRDVDSTLQSPVHIACVFNHLDLFKFLLQKGRCDLRQPDLEGNLPIHLTSKNGRGHMTWFMLCILGVAVLRQANKAGYTPVDLAQQGDSTEHKELSKMLQKYARQSDLSPVTGPVFKWYCLLLQPALFYLVVVIVIQQFSSHQYLVVLAALVLVALNRNNINHRIDYISRWPNPIYVGLFAGGICHTIICYFWVMFPYLNTQWWINLLSVTTTPALAYCFYKLMREDPGQVRESIKDPQTGKPLTIVDLCTMRNPPYYYCFECDLVGNEVSKHCKLCERCFYQMDHHCLFLLRCVACNNHALFVWLLIFASINMALYTLAFVLYILTVYPDKTYTDIMWASVEEQAWPLTLLGLNVCSAFWSVSLIMFQYSVVIKGNTTYFNEFEARNYQLTKKQSMLNFIHFLLRRPLPFKNPHSPLEKVRSPSTKYRDFPQQVLLKSQAADLQVV